MTEWSKVLRSGRSLERGVGSNPTLISRALLLHATVFCRIFSGRGRLMAEDPADTTLAVPALAYLSVGKKALPCFLDEFSGGITQGLGDCLQMGRDL